MKQTSPLSNQTFFFALPSLCRRPLSTHLPAVPFLIVVQDVVSGALRLLFRNFSQRSEITTAFQQVQLLVSEKDVDIYKATRQFLDKMRVLVEKSELWVYTLEDEHVSASNAAMQNFAQIKRCVCTRARVCVGDTDRPMDGHTHRHAHAQTHRHRRTRTDTGTHRHGHKHSLTPTLSPLCLPFVLCRVLNHVTTLCLHKNREVRTHHQRLLRNLDAHGEVLALLRMQCDAAHPEVKQVHEAAYFFLQKFCEENKENQAVLNKHVTFFVDQVRAHGMLACHAVPCCRCCCFCWFCGKNSPHEPSR